MAEVSAVENGARPVARWGVGDLAALTVVTFWGVNFVVVRQVLKMMSPLTFNSLRFVGASLLLLFLLRWAGEDFRIGRSDVARVVLLGLIGMISRA